MVYSGWFEKLTRKVFSLFSKKEVKTPLSFFFRVVAYVGLIVVVAFISVEPELQRLVFLVGVGLFILLIAVVALFAWCRPRNLVYGETGHRAEMKMAYGTDKKELSADEVAVIEGTPNPRALPAGGETE